MGYHCQLLDPETNEELTIDEPHHIKGGTYQLGGTKELWTSITSNYARFYYTEKLDKERGLNVLNGMTGEQSIPVLEKAISQMEGKPTDNYWDGTEGNAKKALFSLLELAKLGPQGVWEIEH